MSEFTVVGSRAYNVMLFIKDADYGRGLFSPQVW